jgi:hypothetical protein
LKKKNTQLKGKRISQKDIQTILPKGTFSRRDPHPWVKGFYFNSYSKDRVNSERWFSSKQQLEKAIKRIRKSAEKRRRNKGLKSRAIYKKAQTNSCRGYFTKGDKHPTIDGLYFIQYTESKEKWASFESLQTSIKAVKNHWRENKDQYKKRQQKYMQSEKGKIKHLHNQAKRRALKKKSSINLTKEQEGVIKQIYAHSVRITKKLKIAFHVDHIVPLSKGGLHHPSNLQVAPASWNCSKCNKHSGLWLPNGM